MAGILKGVLKCDVLFRYFAINFRSRFDRSGCFCGRRRGGDSYLGPTEIDDRSSLRCLQTFG